ncbi:MAG: DUF378 domain-containing protein [Pseudomonadota bacterium]
MDRTENLSSSTAPSGLKVLSTVALVLLIIGGLNWALVGLLGIDLVASLFGTMTVLSRIVYVLVGLGAVYALLMLPRLSRLS